MTQLNIAIGSSNPEKAKLIIDALLKEHGFSAVYKSYSTNYIRADTGVERAQKYAQLALGMFPETDYRIGIDRSINGPYTITHVAVLPKEGGNGKGAWIHHPVLSPDTDDAYADDVKEAVWDALAQLLERYSLSHSR